MENGKVIPHLLKLVPFILCTYSFILYTLKWWKLNGSEGVVEYRILMPSGFRRFGILCFISQFSKK
jgi:hypothetical protein